jgi:hypothetical protein
MRATLDGSLSPHYTSKLHKQKKPVASRPGYFSTTDIAAETVVGSGSFELPTLAV